MKLFFLLLTLKCTLLFSQDYNYDQKNIFIYIKVWGFCKYYHPFVALGTIDWDRVFLLEFDNLTGLQNENERSENYLNRLELLPVKSKSYDPIDIDTDNVKIKPNLDWISDTSIFTFDLIDRFKIIRDGRCRQFNHYVKYSRDKNPIFKEKVYRGIVFPSLKMRMLTLARYWSIIEYFYPYKYLIETDWNLVLIQFIDKFMNVKNVQEYHLTLLKLIAKINDSHALFTTPCIDKWFGDKWAPFVFKIIDSSAVVTGYYDSIECQKQDILIGDVCLEVNHEPINEIIKSKAEYIVGSNGVVKNRNFYYAVFNGQSDSVLCAFQRGDTIVDKIVYRKKLNMYKGSKYYLNDYSTFNIIHDSIGYVNMGKIKIKQVDSIMALMFQTKAIIFDVRNYPDNTLYRFADWLNDEELPFARFTYPDLSNPGSIKYFENYEYCGKMNPGNFKGLVVILCNESTQSHAEFTCMALQTAPNSITVGSQTAGADGNVSTIILPGRLITWISGLGVYYPDGSETQRVGVKIDVEVKPTIQGIREGRDEVLEKAIEIINERTRK